MGRLFNTTAYFFLAFLAAQLAFKAADNFAFCAAVLLRRRFFFSSVG